jgi:hypothetical protein
LHHITVQTKKFGMLFSSRQQQFALASCTTVCTRQLHNTVAVEQSDCDEDGIFLVLPIWESKER